MSPVYWSDPLGLVLLGGVLLVLGAIVARIAKRRKERSKNAWKP
jgi:hypothetical protein